MRYLSHAAVISQVPHVIDICVNEMVARTCKNIMNKKISELIIENKVEYDQLLELKKAKDQQLKEAEKFASQFKMKRNEEFDEEASNAEIKKYKEEK